ncbi:uncharacterized protein TNCV_2139191 [Trichonephila clavipes]|uniref:Uncharacterized protein n=1 Tax=Trichonephila clavipes TaxID=2585209 RepID=A0A8X6S046_TRICX|nr:uncharacterized protein TNCV_2139191 [Trichonephila clavipes]
MSDHTCHAMSKSSYLPIRLNCFLGLLVLPIYRQSKTCVPRFAQRLPRDAPSAATLDQLWLYVETAWTAAPQEYIQSLFDSMPSCMAAVIPNNGGYTNY